MYAQQREVLRVAIQKVYDENRQIFGAGKITAILKEQGYVTSEDTVRRLMADMGLTSIRQRAKALYEKEKLIARIVLIKTLQLLRPIRYGLATLLVIVFKRETIISTLFLICFQEWSSDIK